MTAQTRRVHVGSETSLASLLDEARKEPLELEKDGLLYRLSVVDRNDVWADYDPERAREALAASAGALKGVDRDELLAEIYAEREQDTQGRPA